MSLDLKIYQQPLEVCPSHADHTWNVALNDYSAYTDIRLVADIYKNPYRNDSGSTQDYGKISRLLIPPNDFGHCIFNVETIIYNILDPNPRNLGMVISGNSATTNAYQVRVADSDTTSVELNTNQATIVNDRTSTISYSNGFNGGYEGFQNIYQINEYRILFGVQYTSGSTTTTIVPSNFSAYTSYTGGTISPYSAETQPYGVMIYPGVQDNKQMSQKYYYSANNLTGQYNYLDTKVLSYEMSTGTTRGNFMTTFGEETIPMTILGSNVYQTRYRTHYYKCPIIVGFMYGGNPLFNNTTSVEAIMYLQKNSNNGQYNYDSIQSQPISFTPRTNAQTTAPYSYLQQRIAYGIFKPNPTVRTDSDVAIYLTNDVYGYDYDNYGCSEIVQYKMVGEECLNNPVSFLFMNRQGIWDTYTFTKKYTKKFQMNKKSYNQQKSLNTKWWNRQSYDTAVTNFYGDADEIVTVDSNYVDQNDVVVIEELLMSPNVYIIQDDWLPSANQDYIYPYLLPVQVLNKEVEEYISKYKRIFQYQIEMQLAPYRPYYIPF